MLYRIIDGTLAAGSEILLEHFSFEIKGNEKVAIVGANGTGKTTFLQLLAGERSLERDDKREGKGIWLARNITIGMLHQNPFSLQEEKTVEEEILSSFPEQDSFEKARFEYEQEYYRMLTGFGFSKEDAKKKISCFSGGEKTKLAMIRLFLEKPDLLLLDEPTNHLDLETVEWLEGYIRNYEGAVVMVSHDRFFLDQTVERVWELEEKKLTLYAGNYSQYRNEKRKKLKMLWKQYHHQQEEIQKLEQNIARFKTKPKKAAFARSRKKILERMEKIERPAQPEAGLDMGEILPERLGNKVVWEAEDLEIGYEKMLQKITLRIRRGQKIGILGANGIGKSTFLKTVTGQLPPYKGKYRMGEQIDLGYFEQERAALTEEISVLEHFHGRFPGMTKKDVRNYLAAYLFSGAQVNQSVAHLSGGEKSRLVLAELLAEKPNFLVLDEPTNHMDIPAKEGLERAFQNYKGTLLFVSHDRYFLSQIAEALLIFDEKGISYYPFDYSHYLYQKKKGQRSKEGLLKGELSAEDQALVDGLKSVPKGASLLGRELPQERLYLEWKLRLAEEQMERKREEVQEATQLWKQEILKAYPEEPEALWKQKAEEKEKSWEKSCLTWYEIWCELEEAGWEEIIDTQIQQ